MMTSRTSPNFQSTRTTHSINSLKEVMTAVVKDMPATGTTFCIRTKGLQTALRKLTELHGRKSGTQNLVWAGEKNKQNKQKGPKNAASRKKDTHEAQAPSAQQASRTGYADKLKGTVSSTNGEVKVVKEAATKKKPPPQTNPCVIVPSNGKEYSLVMRETRQRVQKENPELVNKVIKARKTQAGDLLLETLDSESAEMIQQTLCKERGTNEIRTAYKREPTVRILIRDVDESADENEITAQLAAVGVNALNIQLTIANRWGLRLAFCTAGSDANVNKLIEAGSVRVGFTSCKVEISENLRKCFKCHKAGHMAITCTAEGDLSNNCFRCKETGHLAKDCPKRSQGNEKTGKDVDSVNNATVNTVVAMETTIIRTSGEELPQEEGVRPQDVHSK